MADPLQSLIRRLNDAERPSDAELLQRYVAGRDAAAFEVLVWRHGAMVLGTARRILGHDADAEDAFQATFLTLARKAGSIRRGAALPAWLHLVTCRIATRVRCQRRTPRPLADIAVPEASVDDNGGVLDEEIARLPERFRRAVVLCYLEGRSAEEAAEILGVPRGTVLSRLATARRRLRPRLERRGVAPAIPPLSPTLPENLVAATVPLAQSSAGSAHIITLSNGVIQTMLWNKVRWTLAASLIATITFAGIGVGRAEKPAAGPTDPLPATRPGNAPANPPPTAKAEDRAAAEERRAQEQQRDASRRWFEILISREDLHTKGGALEQLLSAHRTLVDAELALCRSGTERIDACERLLKSAKQLLEMTEKRVLDGRQDPKAAHQAYACKLQIEVLLHKDKEGKK